MSFLQQIKETYKVANSACQNTTAVLRNLDYLFLCEPILAEFTHELLYLVDFAEIKIGEGLEDLIYFLLINLMIEIKQELNFLDLFFEIFPAHEFWAFKQCFHGLLIIETLPLHHCEEPFKLLLSFT